MKYAICLALGLAASSATAEVSQADKQEMFAMMADFGASIESGHVPEFFDTYMHPDIWAFLGENNGQTSDEFRAMALEALGGYYATFTASDFEILKDQALFGESLGWSYGVIGGQSVLTPIGGAPQDDCVAIMVFGQDGAWFISEYEGYGELIRAAMPGLSLVTFDHDPCAVVTN